MLQNTIVTGAGAEPGSRKFLGGAPDGLEPNDWPRCQTCEQPMSHLLQTDELTADLALGEQLLNVFMCQNEATLGECEPWSGDGGCNAVLVRPVVSAGATTLPSGVELLAKTSFTLTASDNGVDPETHAKFFTPHYRDLPDDVRGGHHATAGQFGGSPAWIQGSVEGPPPPFAFAGMFDERPWGSGANFGTGIAYLFVDLQTKPAQGHFFWQC